MTGMIDQDFDREVMQCKLPVFVCFIAPWCHSCYPTCLFADELANEYDGRVKFVRVNIEKSPGIAERYHVIAVPTILLFQNSQPVKRLLGFQHRMALKSLLNSVKAKEEGPQRGLVAGIGPEFPQPTVQRYEAHKND